MVSAALEKVAQRVIHGYCGVKFGFCDNSRNFAKARFEFRKWLMTIKSILIIGSKIEEFMIFLTSKFV